MRWERDNLIECEKAEGDITFWGELIIPPVQFQGHTTETVAANAMNLHVLCIHHFLLLH